MATKASATLEQDPTLQDDDVSVFIDTNLINYYLMLFSASNPS